MSATAAAIATGIGMGVGSLASAYANLKNSADTNEANREINRENLAWQKEQWKQQQENFHLQRKWQLDDAASERSWNSVQAQVARYRAAGLNPQLAMYGGAGQNQVTTGSVTPSAPGGSYQGQQMQMQPASINLEGLGMSVGSAMQSYYNAKSEQRSDYSLASQIEVDHMNARTNYLNALTKAKEAGVNERFINKQIEDIDRKFFLDQDKFSHSIEYDNSILELEQERNRISQESVDVEKEKVRVARLAARSQIALNQANIQLIAEKVKETQETVLEMKKNGASKRKIEKYVSLKEKETYEIVKRDNERGRRNDYSGFRQSYTDFTDWLFSPIKGIISIK